MLPNVDNIFLKSVFLPYYKNNIEILEKEYCNLSLKIHNNNGLVYRIFRKNDDKRRLKEVEELYNKRLELLLQLSNRYFYITKNI